MPSPFPGMDPYLESPDDFPDLHLTFITYLKGAIQSRLPEPYFARTGQRVWIEYPRYSQIPDVAVGRETGPRGPVHGGSAVASMEEAGAVIVEAEPAEAVEMRQAFLEIFRRDRFGEPARLVTSIELLSPSNKSSSGGGRPEYLKKQRELLDRDVHLVEIDLLRGGEHATAVPRRKLLADAGRFDYHVSVRDFSRPGKFYTYPFRLEDPLPTIGIPLLPEDGVHLADLQSVFARCYDEGAYSRAVNYDIDPPEPPLDEARLEWVRERIAAWRLRFPKPSPE
jgi:hypothetical protein